MNAAKRLVLVNGMLFVGFGLGFIAAPGFFWESFTGDVFTSSSAAIDVRATHGGLGLGVGISLLLCAKDNVRLGLLGSLIVLGSIICGRVVGLIADDNPNSFMYIFLLGEAALFLAGIFAWIQAQEQVALRLE